MVAWPAMDAAPEPAARAPGLGTLVFAGLVGMVLLWAALILALWSAVDYHVRVLRTIRLD